MGKFKIKINVPAVCRKPIVIVLVGICVMIVGGFIQNKKTVVQYSESASNKNKTEMPIQDGATQSVVTDWRTITEYHQNRLTGFLENVEGVGVVSVMVYCDQSSIIELVTNQGSHTQKTEEKDTNGGNRVNEENQEDRQYLVLEDKDGNQRVVAIKESIPTIKSVCVVCEGGGKMAVQERVTAAIVTLYDLSPNKIVVLPGK